MYMKNDTVYHPVTGSLSGGEQVPALGALNRIRQGLPALAGSEAKVAEWILRNPERLLSMTVRDLATMSAGSQAAVTRLCKSLQFQGYLDLKMGVMADLSQRDYADAMFSEIAPDNPFRASLEMLQESSVRSVQNTLQGLREQDLSTVSDWIHTSGRILVTGAGASAVVAKDVEQKLMRLGYNVTFAENFHSTLIVASLLGAGDLVVAVSYSGRTTDVLEVVQVAKARTERIVAITGYGRNPLSTAASVTLRVAAIEPEVRVGATSSLLGSLTVVDSLLLYLVNRYPEQAKDRLTTTRSAVLGHQRHEH